MDILICSLKWLSWLFKDKWGLMHCIAVHYTVNEVVAGYASCVIDGSFRLPNEGGVKQVNTAFKCKCCPAICV